MEYSCQAQNRPQWNILPSHYNTDIYRNIPGGYAVRVADKPPLAQNIQKYRRLINLRQEDLGPMLNVGQSAVAKWETAKGQPDPSQLPRLAFVLRVTLDQLLQGCDGDYDGWQKVIPKPKRRIRKIHRPLVMEINRLMQKIESRDLLLKILDWAKAFAPATPGDRHHAGTDDVEPTHRRTR